MCGICFIDGVACLRDMSEDDLMAVLRERFLFADVFTAFMALNALENAACFAMCASVFGDMPDDPNDCVTARFRTGADQDVWALHRFPRLRNACILTVVRPGEQPHIIDFALGGGSSRSIMPVGQAMVTRLAERGRSFPHSPSEMNGIRPSGSSQASSG